MFTYSNYAYLRYVILINILVALPPAMSVKGRQNDPLLHATWWTIDQHSAVLVVAAAALLSSAIAFALRRLNVRSRWAYVGCGVLAGDFPVTFYYLFAPAAALEAVPLADMYVTGTVCGAIGGLVLAALLRQKVNPRAPA
jgi:ABC-type phosphate/phosphonate transport system permease subunit